MANGEHDNKDPMDTLRREMHVSIEGVHDHIRLVAEAAAGQSEAIVRKLEEMQNKFDELRDDNLAQHKTLLSVLGDHESRIAAVEQRAK